MGLYEELKKKEYKRNWNHLHQEDRREYMRNWRRKNSNLHRIQIRKYVKATKEKVIGYYSKGNNECKNCKNKDIRVLTIDHVNGNGAEERRKLKRSGHSFYVWLIKSGFPEGYQVLCLNCQRIKEIENHEWYGYKGD